MTPAAKPSDPARNLGWATLIQKTTAEPEKGRTRLGRGLWFRKAAKVGCQEDLEISGLVRKTWMVWRANYNKDVEYTEKAHLIKGKKLGHHSFKSTYPPLLQVQRRQRGPKLGQRYLELPFYHLMNDKS